MPSAKEPLSALFKRIAVAIRGKDGTTEETDKIVPTDYPDRITAIQTGVDTSDADANPSDIVAGKTAYVDGEKITGTLETAESGTTPNPDVPPTVGSSNGNITISTTIENPILYPAGSEIKMEVPLSDFGTATTSDVLTGKTFTAAGGFKQEGSIIKRSVSDLSASGASIIVPAGYYPSNMSKDVAIASHLSPEISRSGGTITATHTQSAGYTAGGTTTATYTIATQAGKTVTPTTYQQTAVASGRLTTGTVYVAGDSNLTASNIKSGVSIFGVSGTYSGDSSILMFNVDVLGTQNYIQLRNASPNIDAYPRFIITSINAGFNPSALGGTYMVVYCMGFNDGANVYVVDRTGKLYIQGSLVTRSANHITVESDISSCYFAPGSYSILFTK